MQTCPYPTNTEQSISTASHINAEIGIAVSQVIDSGKGGGEGTRSKPLSIW